MYISFNPKVVISLAITAAAFLIMSDQFHLFGHSREVEKLITRNADARGGVDAWQAVTSLRLSGEMDLGQGLHVPYILEQKRPGKMCLQFEFNEQTALQCVDGDSGWKQLPFMGRTAPEPMTDVELREIIGSIDPEGLLLNSYERGSKVELIGHETVNGKSASVLEVTLPRGAVRKVYLDDETALDIKMLATRTVRTWQREMETVYSDWKQVDGLLIAGRQETRYVGDEELHFMTVDKVTINPKIDDEHFAMPDADTRHANTVAAKDGKS